MEFGKNVLRIQSKHLNKFLSSLEILEVLILEINVQKIFGKDFSL